jgi:hypothetical protein
VWWSDQYSLDDWMMSTCLVRSADAALLSSLVDDSMGRYVSHFSLQHWKIPGFAPFHIAPLRDFACLALAWHSIISDDIAKYVGPSRGIDCMYLYQ